MQVIHYLNYTAQLFSSAADVLTGINVESAGHLRSLASARHVQVSHLWRIAPMTNNGKYASWDFAPVYPPGVPNDAEPDAVVAVLEAVLTAEKALQATNYTAVWNTQEPTLQGIRAASGAICGILSLVIKRIASNTSKGWLCGNCLCPVFNTEPSPAPDSCPLCGVSQAWFKPGQRF